MTRAISEAPTTKNKSQQRLAPFDYSPAQMQFHRLFRMGYEMPSDARISYWLKNHPIQNFGDMLSELLFDALTGGQFSDDSHKDPIDDFDVIHLIGSVISTGSIKRDLQYIRASGGKRIAYWGCGLRSEEVISSELLAHCSFLGRVVP
jgi:hypothetical protein